ncbi:hypothetical protein [Oscillibacter sp.]|uniref:hypothetical protein n=1 Tax=Oscillibacter sp. TaxID=1945593 RepID=UPI0033991846
MKNNNLPDMSRKPELANKTVQQGRFSVTYDELGYAVKAEKTSNSPGYVVEGVTYGGNGNVVSGSKSE